jgi:hypothetical protein
MPTDKPSLQELVAVNLRYSRGAEPYRNIAYGHLAAKALYFLGRPARTGALSKEIATVLGVTKVPQWAVEQGLRHMLEAGLVEKQGTKWVLSPQGTAKIQADVTRADERQRIVLDRHFPPRIDRRKLAEWFQAASALLFSEFAERWIATTCTRSPFRSQIPADLDEFLRPIAQRSGLADEAGALATGFGEYLNAVYPEDGEQLLSTGMAMCASRYVAANLTADPVTVELIRNAEIVLDTNVLIAIQLESHRHAESLTALAGAFRLLGVTAVCAPTTEAEYVRTAKAHCASLLSAVAQYHLDVVKQAKDAFTMTAVARFCSTTEDFEGFVQTVKDPPAGFGDGLAIAKLDLEEVAPLIAQGEQDEDLKRKLQEAWLRCHQRPKLEMPLLHDAGLVSMVMNRKRVDGRRSFLLTFDVSILDHAMRVSGPQESPFALSLDALLQILAVDHEGLGVDPVVFAPLLAGMLSYQFEPPPDAYTSDDLAYLLDVEERCRDLSDPEIVELANRVNRARLLGKRYDDPSLRLDIQRAFQSKRLAAVSDLSAKTADLQNARDDLRAEKARGNSTREALVNERCNNILKEAKSVFRRNVLWSVAIGCIWMAGSLYLALLAFRGSAVRQVVFTVLSLGGPLEVFGWIRSARNAYRQASAEARADAESQIMNELNRTPHQ